MASRSAFGTLLRDRRVRMLAALAVVGVVGGGLGLIVIRGAAGNQALLYAGLDLTESAEIAGKLDQANIPYKMEGNGSSIFVPRARVLDARIMLSDEGLPTRGSVGYEIFDKNTAFGATSFVLNINRMRALEGELARTIASLEIVRSARVHLVIPERRLFERDRQTPSASVVLSIAGRDMNFAQVRAVRNLVASAVPDLALDRITVLDDKGRLLASGGDSQDTGLGGGVSADERRVAVEERIRAMLTEIVESITGPGAARVQVSADIDFNRITKSSEQFNPDGRVVRSTQTVEESADEASKEALRASSASANLPGDDVKGDQASSNNSTNRVEETVNYEISRTTHTEIVQGGRIRRLSVAVAVDDARVIGAEGASEFEKRSEDELQRIGVLVRSAIGFDESRGDTVEVVNVSFVRPDISMEGAEAPGAFDFDKHDIMRIIEILTLLGAALVMIFLILRPLVRSLTESDDQAEQTGTALVKARARSTAAGAGATGSVSAEAEGVSGASAVGLDSDGQSDPDVHLAQVEGPIRESVLKQASNLVEEKPDESLQIVRSWLGETPAHPRQQTAEPVL